MLSEIDSLSPSGCRQPSTAGSAEERAGKGDPHPPLPPANFGLICIRNNHLFGTFLARLSYLSGANIFNGPIKSNRDLSS